MTMSLLASGVSNFAGSFSSRRYSKTDNNLGICLLTLGETRFLAGFYFILPELAKNLKKDLAEAIFRAVVAGE